MDTGESAEGTAPSAARRTRREPLDSPGSHRFSRERAASAPMCEQSRLSPLHTIEPDESSGLMTAQALVFPHGPTDDDPVQVIRDRLELRAPKTTVVPHPSSHASGRHPSEITQGQLTAQRKMPPPHRLTHRLHGLATDRRREARADPPVPIPDAPRPKGVAEKVERNALVCSCPLAVLAIHHPGLSRVHLQATVVKTRVQPLTQSVRLGLASTVQDAESRPRESHPRPLAERSMNLSTHCAPVTQPSATNPSASVGTLTESSSPLVPASAQHVADDVSAS